MALINFAKWWSKVSGERSNSDVGYASPTFFQHRKVYEYVLPLIKNKTVLDLGCGSGEGDYLLAKTAKSVVGIDKDASAIADARSRFRNKNLTFEQGNFNNYHAKNIFEVVISFQVIEHLVDVTNYLQTIQDATKKGATIVLSTPNATTQSYNENPFHIKEYSESELKKLLRTYFSKIQIYGLFGDSEVAKYEAERKNRILELFTHDAFKLRRFVPREIKILVFSLLAFLVRKDLAAETISISSYRIGPYRPDCIDLIAICQK